jgi:glutamyl-tRNA synthetase
MIRTRFSPSPTGQLHLGNVRAALFSALYAKRADGYFLLRIEDTDAVRSEQKYVDMLQSDLQWLGLHWQEGPGVEGPHAPYFQSQRASFYNDFYKKLEDENKAYPCFCTDQELALNRKLQLARGQAPRYPGTCRKLSKEEVQKRLDSGLKPALRFQIPVGKLIEFVDLVKGPQKFSSDDIGDFIIRRADGSASFMFCNAIDDSLMGVTHVIRGEDHLANTPRQLMILNALQLTAPSYGHLSLITGEDGAKLSKRFGSLSLHDLREQGFLSQAIINYLSRLSHTYEQQTLLSFNELAQNFNLEKLSRSPARFDTNQLLHWQKEAVMALKPSEVWEWLGTDIQNQIPASAKDIFVELMRQNILFPSEAKKWVDILFKDDLAFADEQKTLLKEAGPAFFAVAHKAAEQHQEDIKNIIQDVKTELNISGKQLFMPIRIALTGELHGPELAQIASLLGADRMIKRFQSAEQCAKSNG